MLSIYGKSLRPDAELDKIIELTNAYPEKTIRKWQNISPRDSDNIYIILSGVVGFRRSSDDLSVYHLEGQFIAGITTLFYDFDQFYGVACSDVQVRVIDKKTFIQLVDQHNAWAELSKILSWFICVLSKRDERLVAHNAYTVIREFLLEIHQLITLYGTDINIYDYIQEYTHLARSTIVKILSELKKGEYIVVNKGRLLQLNSLPEKY